MIKSVQESLGPPLGNFTDEKIIAAFSSRSHENMSLSYGETNHSLENRALFLEGIGIHYADLVCAKQIHSANICYAQEHDKGSGALTYESAIDDIDAFITDKKHVPLAIFTADCLSVFLYDPLTPAIGLVHAGWKSTRGALTARTIAAMQEFFKSEPAHMYLGFGPAIRTCCYEVSEEFRGYFPAHVTGRQGRLYMDLAGENKRQACASGVPEAHIVDPGICTSCEPSEYFSYRKEGKACGRLMSVIMLR